MKQLLPKFLIGVLVSVMTMTDAAAIETPDYRVIAEHAEYEVRAYSPYIVAEVTVSGSQRQAGNSAFRILAGYIFGNNSSQQKMAMTAPVESVDTDDGGYVYSFMMESAYSMASLPEPEDPRIRLREVPARTMAVRRFSGTWSDANVDDNLEVLRSSLAEDGMEPLGPPVFARYDGPLKPWFLRRNELMFQIARDD